MGSYGNDILDKGYMRDGDEVIIINRVNQVVESLNGFLIGLNGMSEDAGKYKKSNRVIELDNVYSALSTAVSGVGTVFVGAVKVAMEELLKDGKSEGVDDTIEKVPKVISQLEDIKFVSYEPINMPTNGVDFTPAIHHEMTDVLKKTINEFYDKFASNQNLMREIRDSNAQYSDAIPKAFITLCNSIDKIDELYRANIEVTNEAIEATSKSLMSMSDATTEFTSGAGKKELDNAIDEKTAALRAGIGNRR